MFFPKIFVPYHLHDVFSFIIVPLIEIWMQIASFIKTHIFSRRRPIDGWKYIIEELGPNARKGKGSVSRLPSISDASTQPFKEERRPTANLTSFKGR